MNIKENNLQENVTTDPNVLENQFVRWVTDKITGASQLKKVSGLILKISNILGLQTALDLKINSLPSGFQQLAKVVSGGIEASSIKDGVFASIVEMDTLTDTGLYSPSASITDALMGTIFYVLTGNSAQFILSSKGIWYRQYSGSWSLPMYVGGGNDNIILTYDEAFNLADENKLTPGVSYVIRDYEVTGYSLIILTAASSSLFFQNGYASAPVPKHRYGTYYVGSESVVFLGVWDSTLSPSVGNACIWYNKVFVNMTGNVGTADGFLLDSTNWNLINPITYREFYRFDLHTVTYDFKNNYVRKEADGFGNEFGEDVVPYDGFLSRYNDFGLDIDGGEFVGNKLSRCYNNSSQIGEIVYNTGGGLLYGNKGLFATGAISYNIIHFDAELKNCTIDDTGRIVRNEISGILYDVYCAESVDGCWIKTSVGNFSLAEDGIYPMRSTFSKDYNGGGSAFYPSSDVGGIQLSVTDSRIFASYFIGEGVFTLGAGIDVSPIITSGCVLQSMSNGVVVPWFSDLENSAATIRFSGKYEVRYDVSAICDTKRDVTTYLKVNGVKRQEVWNKKQYTLNDIWVSSSMSNIVTLGKGDVLTFGYDVSGMGVANFTLGQINVIIKYLG